MDEIVGNIISDVKVHKARLLTKDVYATLVARLMRMCEIICEIVITGSRRNSILIVINVETRKLLIRI